MVPLSVTPLLRGHHQYSTFVRASGLTPENLLRMCGVGDWLKSTFAVERMRMLAARQEEISKKTIEDETGGRGLTPVKPVPLSRLGAVFT